MADGDVTGVGCRLKVHRLQVCFAYEPVTSQSKNLQPATFEPVTYKEQWL